MWHPTGEKAMTAMIYKGCGAADYVKNGKVRGLQRYRCKACGCNFTATKARGMPAAAKALATLLDAMGNMSFCGIARLLGVGDGTVLKWIRKEAEALACARNAGHCRERHAG